MGHDLDFERTLKEYHEKIEELKRFSQEQKVDLSKEIKSLEERARAMEDEMYRNLSAWQKTKIARNMARPTTLDYISRLVDSFVELHGDRVYRDDPAIVGGIGFFSGQPVTVIGHQKGKDTKENIARNFGMPHPEGYRKALRLMQQAAKFRRPVITFIDTPGAYPGMAAEERGQSEAIARNLREMASFPIPIICIVTGEGGSGGALGLGVANHIYMLEHAIYSVISPEGAAALLWKDAGKAEQAAETMKITAQDIASFGILDGIIPEPQGGAHRDVDAQAQEIGRAICRSLEELSGLSGEQLVRHRYEKFKSIGAFLESAVISEG